MTSDPAWVPAVVAMIELRVRQKEHRQALNLCDRLVETTGSAALAIPTFKLLRELYPLDMSIVTSLANAFITSDQPDAAVDLLEAELDESLSPADQRKMRIALAMALYSRGDTDVADGKFDLLIRADPNDTRPILAYARTLMRSERYATLLQRVAQWYDLCKAHPQLLLGIAYDLSVTDNDDAVRTAERILRFILDREPENADAMQALGVLLQTTERTEAAELLYRQTLRIAPDRLMAANNLARILCETRQSYQEALDLAERGLKRKPDCVDLIDTRGVVYYHLGRLEKAVKDFSTAIGLYPDGAPRSAGPLFHLGRAQARLGRNHEAAKNLRRALDLHEHARVLDEAEVNEARLLLRQLSMKPGSS